MKSLTYITFVLVSIGTYSSCTLSEPSAGSEYDDMYYSDADIRADIQKSSLAQIPSTSPFSESAVESEQFNAEGGDYYDSSYIADLNSKYSHPTIYNYSDPRFESPSMWNPTWNMYAGMGMGIGMNSAIGFGSNNMWNDPWNDPFTMGVPMNYPYYSGYPIINDPFNRNPFYNPWNAGFYGQPVVWGNPNPRFIPRNDVPVYNVRRPSTGQRNPSAAPNNQKNNPYLRVNQQNATGKRGASGASNPRNSQSRSQYNYGRSEDLYESPSNQRSRNSYSSPSRGNNSYSRPSTRSGSPRSGSRRPGGSPR